VDEIVVAIKSIIYFVHKTIVLKTK